MMEKLKPCPFCGSAATLITNSVKKTNHFSYVFCTKCKAAMRECYEDSFSGQNCKEVAIATWNKRTE